MVLKTLQGPEVFVWFVFFLSLSDYHSFQLQGHSMATGTLTIRYTLQESHVGAISR